MGIFVRVIDKIVFAALFLSALQIPILADHYRQYLAGFYDATSEQVQQYQALADQFDYPSIEAMIDTLRQNPDRMIQEDASNKAQTVAKLDEISHGLETLQQGHYFQQAWYMFSPEHKNTLVRVMDNFAPSVPLSPTAIVFSLITAIVVNLIIWAPFWTVGKVRHLRRKRVRYA
ncbi:DUF2937 family protein [Alteromonas pelagimontana]|uniref:DUF2937 family protein n=1 Tax=Alteromonas pelagimontana TaxID=1858656 RepID=A0A6M4M9F9_9ALTE|nr:DUF2937 family protein [Alteromonas pelagimontana]QJR79803.1 DUF2937 family protein [Alteromonas pelagimontana]